MGLKVDQIERRRLFQVLFSLSAVMALVYGVSYTMGILCVYIFTLGLVNVVCEVSPFGLNKLMTVLPFMGDLRGRGVLYILEGLMTLGPTMGAIGQAGGSLLLIAGAASLCWSYFGPSQTPIGYDDPSTASQGFRRYEDQEHDAGYGQF
mmetsp:Transcript_16177/g.38704  ORF Transcript_16177/g.38704 Transcript_16177/m.38704 type:complete len:149 (-) Transcript_16177:331-777(-)